MTDTPPSPREILELLAEDLSFDTVRARFPELSDERLRCILEEAANMCPHQQRELLLNTPGKNRSSGSRWIANIDGASRGNPGPAGAGASIQTDNGIMELKRAIGRDTCNAAEYEALLLAMNAAIENGVEQLEVRSDSELLVRQMNGVYRVKNRALARRFVRAKSLEKKFKSFNIIHVGREDNRDADRLANQAIEEMMNQA